MKKTLLLSSILVGQQGSLQWSFIVIPIELGSIIPYINPKQPRLFFISWAPRFADDLPPALAQRICESSDSEDAGYLYYLTYTPENQPSTWKWMVGILVSFLGWPIFRAYVSFAEGNVQFTLKRTSAPQLGFIFSSFCPMNMNIHPCEASFKLNVFKLCEGMAVLLMSNICPPWGFCVQQNQESSICGVRKYFIDSRYVISLWFYSILNTHHQKTQMDSTSQP